MPLVGPQSTYPFERPSW